MIVPSIQKSRCTLEWTKTNSLRSRKKYLKNSLMIQTKNMNVFNTIQQRKKSEEILKGDIYFVLFIYILFA